LDFKQILSILERASFFSHLLKNKKAIPQILQGKIVANLFFEHSTRTKFSFEVAVKRLGGDTLNFDAESSSMSKGETLEDTLSTFNALGIDIGIIRHSDDSYIDAVKEKYNFSIINAGAGKFEHPSQSLLDLYTIQEHFQTLENLTITICGDISTSRVASSFIKAMKHFNSKIYLSGPQELMPKECDLPNYCQIKDIDKAMAQSDVVMFLRVQHERHKLFELNIDHYNKSFGLNDTRIKLLKPNAIIMHPGPFNRDVEIASHLIEHKQSKIFKQKENGVYTRMAILEWIVS
jgi:aspartate carbamoyltransferase catalytic subunit